MKTQEITASNAPKPIGPYSQAVRSGNLIFVSGQIPIDLKTGRIIENSIEGQTLCVLNHIEAILKATHLNLEHVVKTEIFLKDLNDFQAMNRIYAEKFSFPIKPARQTVQVTKLPMDALIEISCIAIYS